MEIQAKENYRGFDITVKTQSTDDLDDLREGAFLFYNSLFQNDMDGKKQTADLYDRLDDNVIKAIADRWNSENKS